MPGPIEGPKGDSFHACTHVRTLAVVSIDATVIKRDDDDAKIIVESAQQQSREYYSRDALPRALMRALFSFFPLRCQLIEETVFLQFARFGLSSNSLSDFLPFESRN